MPAGWAGSRGAASTSTTAPRAPERPIPGMFCQVCGLKNRDDEEVGETQEEIPFDEHLLERISTLEDVVKRTGEAVKSLFESVGNLEKNLFVAHTGILALQELLERQG